LNRTMVAGLALVALILGAAVVVGVWVDGAIGGGGHAGGPGSDGSSRADRDPPDQIPDDAEAAIIDRVVDGDTIRVIAEPGGSIRDGGSIRVRLLNIDTPELARDGRDAECGALEATDHLEELVAQGDLVWLVADREDRDRFERPLRGVWTDGGVFLNERLAEEGWAEAVLVPPNDRFHRRIEAAVAQAQAAGRGIWGELCVP
jgi:micrococcal nuclease